MNAKARWCLCLLFVLVVSNCVIDFSQDRRLNRLMEKKSSEEISGEWLDTLRQNLDCTRSRERENSPKVADPWDVTIWLSDPQNPGTVERYGKFEILQWWEWDARKCAWKRDPIEPFVGEWGKPYYWKSSGDFGQIESPDDWVLMMTSVGPDEFERRVAARKRTEWDRVQDARIDSLFARREIVTVPPGTIKSGEMLWVPD